MKKQPLVMIVMLAILCFASGTIGFAQTTCTPVYTTPGSFDTCFGYEGTGKVITNVPSLLRTLYSGNVARQGDGKILSLFEAPFDPGAGNNFSTVVIRYNADGTLDTSFASGGVLYIDWRIGGGNLVGRDLAVQLVNSFDSGGNPIVEERIIVVGGAVPLSGSSTYRLKAERYLPSGIKDYTFGADGTGTVVISANTPFAVVIQPDQKILVAGDSGGIARLNQNGTPDATFGVNGISQVLNSGVRGIAVQSDGKILTAATSVVTRYNANGTLDTTFGTSGRTNSKILTSTRDVKILANGYILAAGYVTASNKHNMALARFTPNGQLDTTFGGGTGKASISVSAANDRAHNIDLQSNGKIVLFGDADGANGYTDFGIARFNANGTIDTTFGQGGKVIWDYVGANDTARGLVQRNVCGAGCDRIVAMGPVRSDPVGGYGISRAAAISLIP